MLGTWKIRYKTTTALNQPFFLAWFMINRYLFRHTILAYNSSRVSYIRNYKLPSIFKYCSYCSWPSFSQRKTFLQYLIVCSTISTFDCIFCVSPDARLLKTKKDSKEEKLLKQLKMEALPPKGKWKTQTIIITSFKIFSNRWFCK